MRVNVHWRELLVGAAGVWLAASPLLLRYDLDTTLAVNAYAVGTGLIVFCLLSAWRLEELGSEIVNILLGGWLILSPYALGFQEQLVPRLMHWRLVPW
jgi:hypothetical protein